jgi:hypothetical protein
MMYVLTSEEYSELLERKAVLDGKDRAVLQALCTKIADEMPVARPWSPSSDPSPWGCILSRGHGSGYCDNCPVTEICPHPHKEWSK